MLRYHKINENNLKIFFSVEQPNIVHKPRSRWLHSTQQQLPQCWSSGLLKSKSPRPCFLYILVSPPSGHLLPDLPHSLKPNDVESISSSSSRLRTHFFLISTTEIQGSASRGLPLPCCGEAHTRGKRGLHLRAHSVEAIQGLALPHEARKSTQRSCHLSFALLLVNLSVCVSLSISLLPLHESLYHYLSLSLSLSHTHTHTITYYHTHYHTLSHTITHTKWFHRTHSPSSPRP